MVPCGQKQATTWSKDVKRGVDLATFCRFFWNGPRTALCELALSVFVVAAWGLAGTLPDQRADALSQGFDVQLTLKRGIQLALSTVFRRRRGRVAASGPAARGVDRRPSARLGPHLDAYVFREDGSPRSDETTAAARCVGLDRFAGGFRGGASVVCVCCRRRCSEADVLL